MNIYALSSGRGPSGIAIIRLSGSGAGEISKVISKESTLNAKKINLYKFYNIIVKTADLIAKLYHN